MNSDCRQCSLHQKVMALLRIANAALKRENAALIQAVPSELAYQDVLDHHRHTPEGFLPIAAYTDGEEIVVLRDTPEDESCEGMHDCDVMGCSSVSHVLLRVDHPYFSQPRKP